MVEPRKFMGGFGNRLFQYAYLYSQVRQGKLPDIYLQDFNHFHQYKEELKQILGEGIEKSDYISLHVRRGDYINNPHYVDLTQTDYYDKAIAEFPNEKFLVFCADRQEGSNDTKDKLWCWEWARKKGINFELWNGKNEVDDFNRMAGCKGHITANSSFSFWASYIGGGITIAPKQWFADGRTIPLPEEFILI